MELLKHLLLTVLLTYLVVAVLFGLWLAIISVSPSGRRLLRMSRRRHESRTRRRLSVAAVAALPLVMFFMGLYWPQALQDRMRLWRIRSRRAGPYH